MKGDILLNLYFIVILAIGYNSVKKIKGSSDFFLASKKAGVIEIAGSLLATILGSSAILGSVASAYSIGWAGSWFMLCASIGLFILLPLIKYFKNFKGYNLPELMGEFYGEEVKKISSIIIAIAWIGIVAAQIMGAAQVITIFSSFNYETAVIVSGVTFIVYTILGGQFSIIKTDCIQLVFILVGLVICYLYTSTGALTYSAPNMINEKFGKTDLLVMLLTYSSTFFVGPDIYSRIFCAKDQETAKKAVILSIGILIPLSFILASIGVYAANIYPELDTTKTSPLLYVVANSLPPYISLLMYFGLLSAVISSADTSLLTSSSIFAQVFTGNLKDIKSIKVTRVFIAVFGAFSIIVAIKIKYILSSLLLALSVYSGALIIPCLAGMLGYRTSKKYVLLAIVVGGITAFIGKIYSGSNANYVLILAFVLNSLFLFIPKLISKKAVI